MMKQMQLGNSDVSISEITFGAWAIGGWLWGGNDEADSIAAIHAALEHGMTSFDTAPVYGFGYSEEVLGQVLKGKRDQVQILSKYGLIWDRPKGVLHNDTVDQHGIPRKIKRYARKESIISECEQSLRRLQTDYIDLYQIHWPDPETPIDDTLEAIDRLIDQGKIRAAGVCNFDAEQMEAALSYFPLVSNQVPYSMANRQIETEIVPQAIQSHTSVLAYSPLQRGLLTGKIKSGHQFPSGDSRANSRFFQEDFLHSTHRFLDQIRPIATDHGVSLAQLVLRWTLEQPGISVVLAGARNPQQVVDNAAAADLSLTREEIDHIQSALHRWQK